MCDNATAVDIKADPQRRRFVRSESDFGRSVSDFALQSMMEGRAAKTELVRVVLRWDSRGVKRACTAPPNARPH